MSQSFDSEVAEKLKPIIDLGNDNVIPKMREGAENTVELAKRIGAASLERTASALVSSAESMGKVFAELNECLEKLNEYYKRLDNALA